MTTRTQANKVERSARLKWVPIANMRVNPLAQREIQQARVDRIAAALDVEQIGVPTVNLRDGSYYVIDGQHRVEALRQIGWEDQQIQCWVYEGLTEAEEAETFLKLNDTLTVSAFDRFTKGVAAGRDVECEIDRVVRAQGLVITRDKIPGAIGAVAALQKVWHRSDSATLARALRLIRDAYGDGGYDSAVIDGFGLVCQRYNGQLDSQAAAEKLSRSRKGVLGLLQSADVVRKSTGATKGVAVAAAAVEAINSGKGGKKLPGWWSA